MAWHNIGHYAFLMLRVAGLVAPVVAMLYVGWRAFKREFKSWKRFRQDALCLYTKREVANSTNELTMRAVNVSVMLEEALEMGYKPRPGTAPYNVHFHLDSLRDSIMQTSPNYCSMYWKARKNVRRSED